MRVDDEWDRNPEIEDTDDLLFVTYNTETTSTEKLLESIRKEGFEAEVRRD